ncbi:MAG: cytochrome-c peroxidase [Gammaproteobacteria bacterium]|nr:cytochrome-c peroxidase [Gammaproteobacteria bacterium]
MTILRSTVVSTIMLFTFTSPAFADFGSFVPLPYSVPAPKDNPSTPEKISLGKQLFFDARLSVDGTVSCNSCHDVQGNGTDSRSTSVGVKGQIGGRSAPSVWNAAFLSAQMWDGRLPTLEDQAKGPILNPIEMAMPHPDAAVSRISSIPGYAEQFAKVFGGETPVTYDNIARAIATYERTLITPNSRFDQYLLGNSAALTRKEQNGMETFRSLGCHRCHRGPAMAGPKLANGQIFLQWFPAFPNPYIDEFKLTEDLGYNNGKEDELEVRRGKWRVPSLRNIANTAPYFHNGSVKSLDKAVRVMARSQLNRELSNYEADVLVAFLKTLTGEYSIQATPMLPADMKVSLKE